MVTMTSCDCFWNSMRRPTAAMQLTATHHRNGPFMVRGIVVMGKATIGPSSNCLTKRPRAAKEVCMRTHYGTLLLLLSLACAPLQAQAPAAAAPPQQTGPLAPGA